MDTVTKTDFINIEIEPGIKGILIDLDNTIYEYLPCHEQAMKAVYKTHHAGKGVSYDEFLKAYSSAQKNVKSRIPHHAASHSRLLYFQNLTEARDGKINLKEALDSDNTYWSNFHKTVQLKKEAIDFIHLCRSKGIKICLVTDLTASVQFYKIIEIGADGLFDFIVTSEEAGTEKPGADIFALALRKLGLTTNEVIMIGDDKNKDINGAHAFGIKAYLV